MFKRINKRVDRFMEQVKLGADMAVYGFYIKENGGVPIIEEDLIGHIEGYPIYFNKALKGYGTIVAVSTHVKEMGGAILIDNYFSRLSPIGKRFVLLHELGHLKEEHLAKAIEIAKNKPQVVEIMELEYVADEFAFNKMGIDALNGLLELRDMVKELLPESECLNHIASRIEVLKEKCSVL